MQLLAALLRAEMARPLYERQDLCRSPDLEGLAITRFGVSGLTRLVYRRYAQLLIDCYDTAY